MRALGPSRMQQDEHNLRVKVSICGVENVGSIPSARLYIYIRRCNLDRNLFRKKKASNFTKKNTQSRMTVQFISVILYLPSSLFLI